LFVFVLLLFPRCTIVMCQLVLVALLFFFGSFPIRASIVQWLFRKISILFFMKLVLLFLVHDVFIYVALYFCCCEKLFSKNRSTSPVFRETL
jgi:hypothetical protein